MFTLTAERPDGQRLTLTEYGSAYKVTYTGLGPVYADIVTSSMGMVDGEKFNSAIVHRRNVVLTVYITGNVEANRIRLYSFFSPKNAVKLHYKNGIRDVYTEGIVETCEPFQFDPVQRVQISIICPRPHLIGAEEIVKDISGVLSLFEFPFSIASDGIEFSGYSGEEYAILQNAGDTPTGFIITVYARAKVSGPVIYNTITNEAMRISGTLEAGHTLTINTNDGEKKITIADTAGQVENAFHRKRAGSVWLKLQPGDNYISYAAEEGAEAMAVTLRHNNLFVGV